MAENEAGEKTEEATDQRREEFRRRGQVANTRELAIALMLFGAAGVFSLLGPYYLQLLQEILIVPFEDFLVVAAKDGSYRPVLLFGVQKAGLVLAPLMGLIALAAIASSVLQTGFLTNEEALQIKWERVNPVEGLKRLFSLRSLMEGVKAILKIILIGLGTYLVLRGEFDRLPLMVHAPVGQVFQYIGIITLKVLGVVGLFMLGLAGLDYIYQRFDLEKQMRMTKQEVKEELKSREGDPLIKARIRRIQREIATRRMMEQVPKADVIVTNPTHIACALRYSSDMVAPVLVAKGAELLAEKIKQIARENGVPVVENKPLARTMYKTMKVGQAIPRELYAAVAEVLSYIYRLKRKRKV